MASIRARTDSRGSRSPASIMPSIAALTASAFIFMKSVSVLSRSKMIARINARPARLGLLGRWSDPAAQADLAIVDADVVAAGWIVADPRLVRDGGPVPPVVGQREKDSIPAFAALGKPHVHPDPLPWFSRSSGIHSRRRW